MELPSILALTLLLISPITAQSTSSLTTSLTSTRSSSSAASSTLSSTGTPTLPSSTSTATISPGNVKWGYQGCYNETTGLASTNNARALAGMEQTKSDDMTVEACFNICNAKGTQFAGLEYSSECFCANYLNSLSVKLADTDCSLPCAGNSSIVCGGALRLSVYQVKTQAQIDADKKKAEGKSAGLRNVPQASSLALGIALGMVFWLA